ncbi:MAG: NADH-quinone oxidoreductase subunit L [SAR202 cluster bacterium]|nr:NADH-quinone oxidoreductase subunit L [SAR202 cluster bacterium]|tara:strand:+ start:4182 stop:6035 length:1854 start_codon:yes stop_codon:yes gene_type:complete
MALPLGFIGREGIWLLPVLPSISFLLLVFWRRHFPNEGALISIVSITCAFLLSISILVDFQINGIGHQTMTWFQTGAFTVTIGITADTLSVIMIGLITLVSLAVQIYSLGYMKGEERIGLYYAYHSLFAASMLILVLANSFLLLYFGWELVGLCSFLLINFHFGRHAATNAAKKAFITTRIGDVGLLIGLGILFVHTGTFDIATTFDQIGAVPGTLLTIIGLLMFVGAMGKSAQFPFHVWLPDAMEGPTPVSALIHAATMVTAGAFLVARAFPIFEAANVLHFIAGIGLFTAIFGGLLALGTRDIKRVLAYSTISQLGFMFVGLGFGSVTAGMFHLITHGVFKALLFLAAGAVLHALHRGNATFEDISGIGWRRTPITAAAFFIGGLALAGIPPLSGFFSKEEIFLAVLHADNYIYLGLLFAGSLLTAMYITRLFVLLFLSPSRGDVESMHDPDFSLKGPLIILTILAIPAGLILAYSLPTLLGEHSGFHVNFVLASISTGVGLTGIAFAYLIYRKTNTAETRYTSWTGPVSSLVRNEFYMDRGNQWIVNTIVIGGSHIANTFDRIVVNDIGVNGSANVSLIAGRILRRIQTGQMPNYALAIIVGTVTAIGVVYVLA